MRQREEDEKDEWTGENDRAVTEEIVDGLTLGEQRPTDDVDSETRRVDIERLNHGVDGLIAAAGDDEI